MTRLAAVTGATGFLGRRLVRTLAAEGWTVRALVRRDPTDPSWLGVEPQVVPGDLNDVAALERLCDGAQAVIHVAGVIKARSRPAFDAVNRDGAGRLAAAARATADDAHVVLVSSLAAREPQLSDYAGSKRAGEDASTAILGPRLSVVRPAVVYGPGDRETLSLFRAALTSPVLPVFNPEGRIAMIHVDDAARQIAAIAAGAPLPRPVVLCDDRPEGYGWGDLMAQAAAACGARPRIVRAPDDIVRLLGAFGALGRLVGANPMLTPGKAREILHRDWKAAPNELAKGRPAPVFGLSEGFDDAVAWYRSAGWLAVC